MPLPGATAQRLAANAWEVVVPRGPQVERLVKGPLTAQSFDGATLALDGAESLQVLGSGEEPGCVRLTVLL